MIDASLCGFVWVDAKSCKMICLDKVHQGAKEAKINVVDDLHSNTTDGVDNGKKWSSGGDLPPHKKIKAMHLQVGPGRDDLPFGTNGRVELK